MLYKRNSNNELDSYLNFNWDYYLEEEADYDILITGTGPYDFPGVTADNPVDLINIANINFVIGNGNSEPITSITTELIYNTNRFNTVCKS